MRCGGCAQLPVLCMCDEVTPAATGCEVVVVQHHNEAPRTSNSARVLPLALAAARIVVRRPPEPVPPFGAGAFLLFPDPAAPSIANVPQIRTLVVPDGTWREARRIARREPALAALPRVRLEVDALSDYELRTSAGPGMLSTAEAVAHALLSIESVAVGEHVLGVHRLFVERALRARAGSISDAGELPPGRSSLGST